jgi:hypothetical protein
MTLDYRAILPASAAVAFIVYLVWKMWPREGRHGPLDPRITEARERAGKVEGAARSQALCEAGALADEAGRATAAFGYYLRAARADVEAEEPVRGMSRALARRPRALERALWRHLGLVPLASAAGRATLEELGVVYKRLHDRSRRHAVERILVAIHPTPEAPAHRDRPDRHS